MAGVVMTKACRAVGADPIVRVPRFKSAPVLHSVSSRTSVARRDLGMGKTSPARDPSRAKLVRDDNLGVAALIVSPRVLRPTMARRRMPRLARAYHRRY